MHAQHSLESAHALKTELPETRRQAPMLTKINMRRRTRVGNATY